MGKKAESLNPGLISKKEQSLLIPEAYKKSEVGVIPTEWEVRPLREVLHRGQLGGNYPNQDAESPYPLIKMGNVGRGNFNMSTVEYVPEQIPPDPSHLLRRGDVLFNTRNTLDLVGKVAIWRKELPVAYFNSNLMKLEFDPKVIVCSSYANYALNSERSIALLRARATGTTSVAAIYTRDLLQLPVAVPSKPEQRAIAEVLSDVDGLLGALEKLIAKKRATKQAAMQQLLTGKTRLPRFSGAWENTTLGEVIVSCSSGATPYRGRPEYYKGNIRWITSGELKYTTIFETEEHITEEAVKNTNLKVHPPGTFLMAITGLEAEGTRGSCGIVGADSTTNQSCMAVYPSSQLLPEYLFHYYTYRGKSLALQYCQGTKQQSYTAKTVKLLPITMPLDTSEQGAIATILSEMDEEIASFKRRLDKIRAIKQGMMQQLLTGRTRLV